MRYSLLVNFEKSFKRTPFEAVENTLKMTADEQRWFVYQFRVKDNAALAINDVEEWTSKEMGDAISDFFGVAIPPIPS